jgi:hypothetical protein
MYTESVDEAPYKGNRSMFSACHAHVVCSRKYRRKALMGPIEERLNHKLPMRWMNRYVLSPNGGAALCLIKQEREQQKHV